MREYSTYRRSVAAVLLLLYVFVATPVQLWHKHAIPEINIPVSKVSTVKQDQPDGIVISKATISADKCSVCSHQYAACTWDELNPDIVPESAYNLLTPALSEPLFHVPHFLFSNKSPPATVC